MERWGALSVKDHQNARALAAEVLLYDRLIVPEPQQGDTKGWDQWDLDGLARRLEQLGDDLAYRAVWSTDLRGDWQTRWDRFKALMWDAKNLSEAESDEAAQFLTRAILSMRHPVVRPMSGTQPEVIAVYRSNRDAHLPIPRGMRPEDAADYVVGIRLLAPDDADPEEALRRAIDIARDGTFRQRRRAVQSWQRDKIKAWSQADPDKVDSEQVQEAMRELDSLAREFNQAIKRNTQKRRVEAAILTGLIASSAIALGASMAPAAFAGLSVGTLAGAKVASIGGFGASALLHVKKHFVSASEPDAAARVPVVGAMFHQVENRASWQARRFGGLW